MNKWRQKHPDFGKPVKKARPTDDGGSTEELNDAAEDIYSVAASHRDGVKARDAAAKARRKKGARRG